MTLRFFGYFTILSNLAVCMGCVRLVRAGVLGTTVAAVLALCIGVTACVYVLRCRACGSPADCSVVDAGLH